MGSISNPVALQALSLENKLSAGSRIHTNPEDAEFQRLMIRFTDLDKKIPAAIIQPANEEDIVVATQYAIANGIPFVPKAGGHSIWSNIGEEGWVLDLTLYDGLTFNRETRTATIQAGVKTKQFNEVVSDAGCWAFSPGASTVGMVAFVLGGGRSWITALHGLAVDHLISARILTADKGLVSASATENKDLFWALKGAGWFFGIVTEITVQCFPLENPIISRTFMFGAHQVNELAKAIESIANPGRKDQQGLAVMINPPGAPKPIIMVSTMNYCSQEEAIANTTVFDALGPIKTIERSLQFKQITEAAEALNTQGGFKGQVSAGISTFKAEIFVKSFALYEDFISKNPKCSRSVFGIDWAGNYGLSQRPLDSSAYTHRDRRVWVMPFNIGEDPESAKIAEEYCLRFIDLCQEEEEKAFFPNHTRVHPLETRYRGEKTLAKLKELKKIWDPRGVFTDQLL